jgi:photosystem II stability/assembly factor-like uncharacterized protein
MLAVLCSTLAGCGAGGRHATRSVAHGRRAAQARATDSTPRAGAAVPDARITTRRTLELRDAKLLLPRPDQPPAAAAIALSGREWLIVTESPRGRQGLERTADAGRHWAAASVPQHRLARLLAAGEPTRRGGPYIEQVFTSRREGWRIPAGEPNESPSYPPYGEVEYTSDGGRHWHDTGQFADGLSALPGGFALISGVFKGGDELAVTRDGGRHWRILTPIERIGANTGGALGRVLDSTSSGTFLSRDAGVHWAPASTKDEWLTDVPGLIVRLDTARQRCRLLVSHDGGHSYQTFATPGLSMARQTIPYKGVIPCGEDNFAFGTSALGIASTPGLSHPFWRTSDGGRTWTTVPSVVADYAISGAGVLASGRLDLVIIGGRSVALSHDAGRTWTRQRLPRGGCTAATAWRAELWVACGSTIFASRDAGGTWAELNAPAWFVPLTATAIGPRTLLAAAPPRTIDSTVTPGPGSLWRSRDGGVTWTHFWPRLPVGR